MKTFTQTTTATDWRPGADCAGGLRTTIRSDRTKPWTTPRPGSGIDPRRVTGAGPQPGRSCNRALQGDADSGPELVQRSTRSRTVNFEGSDGELENQTAIGDRK